MKAEQQKGAEFRQKFRAFFGSSQFSAAAFL